MTFKKIVAVLLLACCSLGMVSRTEAPASASSAGTEATPSFVIPATGQWSDGWYQDADGYDKAVEEYKQGGKTMMVYMSTPWCPYCRRFEKGVLSAPMVRDLLKDKIKVVINPESGPRESSIASQYRIRGFPSLYLHPPQPGRAVQLYTGVTAKEFTLQVEEYSK